MNVSPISQTSIKSINHTQRAFTAQKNAVPHNSKKSINYVSYTGYGALAAGIASGITAGFKKFKAHKYLAYTAGILSLLHLGIAETKKYQYRKQTRLSNNV